VSELSPPPGFGITEAADPPGFKVTKEPEACPARKLKGKRKLLNQSAKRITRS